MKKILIPVLVLIFCFTIIWKWTLGFSSFTIFSYTLNSVKESPRVFPVLPLIDQDGQVLDLNNDPKYKLVNFVYLDCPYVCHKVNNELEGIYHGFDKQTVPSKLEFVTISFDLAHDGISKLKRYRKLFEGQDINGWNFAVPYKTNQLTFDSFLHQIGIWKYTIPSTGIINHAVYMFLIDKDNRIVQVFDPATQSSSQIEQDIKKWVIAS